MQTATRSVTYEDVRQNEEIKSYITQADRTLGALGFTEHYLPHVVKTAEVAEYILLTLGYPKREAELARIAGYMHDIGNVVNRIGHAQIGAVLAVRLLEKMGMETDEIVQIVSAIGNHDEGTAAAISPMAAALILADKTDVRRSRVRNEDPADFDIHDRVNYAAEESKIYFNPDRSVVILELKIDTAISAVMDYFEIFLGRMMLCRKAADYLHIRFSLLINGQQLL
ncbi:MAG: HD domain-containing protein [Culturomica sp.]|jgi:HD superfamily phosphodiesterase|nr:HD domain-containing protein [Culturomica sp.]